VRARRKLPGPTQPCAEEPPQRLEPVRDEGWCGADPKLGGHSRKLFQSDDFWLIKFKALTKGADVVAPKVFKGNIEGMAAWARQR
jgi:hypothetical protein